MATSYTVTIGGAAKASAPVIFDSNQAKNPTGAAVSGMGQAGGQADGATLTGGNFTAIGGASIAYVVSTDTNPNTP